MSGTLSPAYRHDPDAVLDYAIDWAAWLAEATGDSLASCAWEVVGGTATLSNAATGGTPAASHAGTITGTQARIYVRSAAPGTVTLRCRVVSSQGRTDDRTGTLLVGDR